MLSSIASSADADVYDRLIAPCAGDVRAQIGRTLDRFPQAMHRACADFGVRIVSLAVGERYADASLALRRLRVDVDRWMLPPAGLFVVEERTVYLRSTSAMTVGHEYAHAIDCMRGGGVYRSSHDDAIRGAFANARDFVTPYAATAVDEYWAECVRAYVSVNDAMCLWPIVSRTLLERIDPAMHAIIASVFASFEA